jgi:hypothetical protein
MGETHFARARARLLCHRGRHVDTDRLTRSTDLPRCEQQVGSTRIAITENAG